jgi:hypothetical protein
MRGLTAGGERLVAVGAALALAVAASAQQADVPTKEDPLRFTAFAVSMPAGEAGVVQIAIERWTTDDERKGLLDVLAGASIKAGGQDKLLEALQKIKPRAGFIRTPNSLGWDIKYARENLLSDGTRQIVIATDKPVGFLAASRGSRVLDYPFTFVEMRMKPDGKGEGRLLAATAIAVKDRRIELENYGQEPVRLTTITQDKKKEKK